jgi:AcrR family transcriptional regulator
MSAATRTSGPARRAPTQERSRRRVERILDAAAEVFARIGIDAATTEEIAERAGTSIGSLYRFFPDKKAIFSAIVVRYGSQVRTLFDEVVLPLARAAPWHRVLEETIDALAAFHRSDAGYRAILRNWNAADLLEAETMINREFGRRTEELLAMRARSLSPSRRPVVAEVIVETISAMLIASTRPDAPHGERLIAEAKVMLRSYLAPYVRARRKVRGRRSRSSSSR